MYVRPAGHWDPLYGLFRRNNLISIKEEESEKSPWLCFFALVIFRAASVSTIVVVHFGRLARTGLLYLLDLILMCPGNSSTEPYHHSLMHRFIPFHFQLSHPYSCPWYNASCSETVSLKQLAFSSWKANPTEDNLR